MVKILRNCCDFIYFCFLLFLLFVLLTKSQLKSAVSDGLNLFTLTLLPSLFPYIILSKMLCENKIINKCFYSLNTLFNFLFNVSGIVGFAYVISLISGYPIGAKLISEYKEKKLLTNNESIKGAILCSTSSPVFTISIVGITMLNSISFGIKLFIVHFISSVIIGFIFSFYKGREKLNINSLVQSNTSPLDSFIDSIAESTSSILIVGSIITIFYLFTELLLSLNILSPIILLLSTITKDQTLSEGIVLSFFECSKGLSVLATTKMTIYTLPIFASVCGFGGISVILQSLMFIKKAKIKTTVFLLSKVVSVAVNFVVGLIISFCF